MFSINANVPMLTLYWLHQRYLMGNKNQNLEERLHDTRGEEKPTRCHWMLYCTYDMLNMFRALICPSPGARDYMCFIAAYGVQCLVAGCRGSGAGEQAMPPGGGMLHDSVVTSSWFFFSTHIQRCTDKHTSRLHNIFYCWKISNEKTAWRITCGLDIRWENPCKYGLWCDIKSRVLMYFQ